MSGLRPKRYNPFMESRWLTLGVVLVLLAGCASDSVPPPTASKPSPKVDAFGLPLVIVIDVPEVPKEIQGPSPPIQQEPKHSGKP